MSQFISSVVLGRFEWVFDGFGSFHILVTTVHTPKTNAAAQKLLVSSSFNSIEELKITYPCLQSNLVISKPEFKYIKKI